MQNSCKVIVYISCILGKSQQFILERKKQDFIDNARFFSYIYIHINYKEFPLEDYMKITPLQDRVLVQIEKTESKTASGIIIPDTAQEKTQIAVVVAIGDDSDKIKVKVKQRVMYDKYAGTQIKLDGEDHLILKADDIIAIID